MKNINFGKLIGEKETREGKVNVERQFYMAEKGESENQPQHLMESPGDSEDSFSLALSGRSTATLGFIMNYPFFLPSFTPDNDTKNNGSFRDNKAICLILLQSILHEIRFPPFFTPFLF